MALHVSQFEISSRVSHEPAQSIPLGLHAFLPASGRTCTHLVFETVLGFRVDSCPHFSGFQNPSETESQKTAPVHTTHQALFPVHLEFGFSFMKAGNAFFHPYSRFTALHINLEVIRIAAEPMSPPFQFLVQFIQQNVGQQRAEWSALRGTHFVSDLDPVLENACLQILAYQA